MTAVVVLGGETAAEQESVEESTLYFFVSSKRFSFQGSLSAKHIHIKKKQKTLGKAVRYIEGLKPVSYKFSS